MNITYGPFKKIHLAGIWFCVARDWHDADTKVSGKDHVRDESGKIVAYPEWQAEDVIQYFEEGGE